jgi:ABC-2 type transport system ATP-binding protein
MAVIETNGLTRYYGPLCAVDHLDLAVDHEIFGILGPNGSGKTTTVLMLTTLLSPTEGRASICGFDVVKDAPRVREKISYVPQDMAVDIKLTGRENVLLFARLYGVPDYKHRVEEALSVMELTGRADDLVRTYSGGMRRRLELAQALVHDPEVLFLDEPTIGLDVTARKRIWEHIHSLRKEGMTIFVTTHYMDEADHACDRVGIIDRGRIVALDSPARLKSRLQQDLVFARVSGVCPVIEIEGMTYLGQSGDEISFAAENGSEAVPAIKDALTSCGLHVYALSVREPTLDDVFIHCVDTTREPEGFDDRRFRSMLRRRK